MVANDLNEHIPLIEKKYHDLVMNNHVFLDLLVNLKLEYDHGYMEYSRNKEKFFKSVRGREVDCV